MKMHLFGLHRQKYYQLLEEDSSVKMAQRQVAKLDMSALLSTHIMERHSPFP